MENTRETVALAGLTNLILLSKNQLLVTNYLDNAPNTTHELDKPANSPAAFQAG